MKSQRKASSVNATSWDKIAAQDAQETLPYRDVHSQQQLDRRVKTKKRSKTPGLILGGITGVVVSLVVWLLYSTIIAGVAFLGNQFGDADTPAQHVNVGYQFGKITMMKVFLSLGLGLVVFAIISSYWNRQVDKFNVQIDHSDINEHYNDQHIMLPEELQRKYSWFPDVGAHSHVQVNSMLSHVMLSTKGLKKVEVTHHANKDVKDKDGDILYYAGEVLYRDDGNPMTSTEPIIDMKFGESLYEASEIPADPSLRLYYDTRTIPYNLGGKNRSKYGSYATVSELINDDWEFPSYEIQRPAGAYIVDCDPVNTMVIAMTRAGKGQGYIEPVIDMWGRELDPSNMVINDPKGELLVKNRVSLAVRGFEVIQFNLIFPMTTDIYNILGLAADAARDGDFTKCAQYVENIATVFFPVDGGEDPVWPNAANNAFKRAAYGLIDFYLEEEYELRNKAAVIGMDPEILEQKLDTLWGKVTLYNCYQLFVQMTSKKMKNPLRDFEKRVEAGEFTDPEELLREQEMVTEWAEMWNGQPEMDLLTLYFNATSVLPRNNMRGLVLDAHNALQSMAGADKMLASVYGIATTAMSFFADKTISTLTSGKPSQNTDLAGLSFPRRLGVRFAANYITRDRLIGLQANWSAYDDPMYTKNLGKDFLHDDIIDSTGWARYIFKGIFPHDQVWLKLELTNPQTDMLVRTFYFQFTKTYQLSFTGRHYVMEPVTGRKIVRNGVLREMIPIREGGKRDGTILGFEPGDTTYPDTKLDFANPGVPEKVSYQARTITQTLARYSEQPKALFLVTPPHLMKYARLILILIKQLFDVSVDQSYLTKADQKPLYKVRFMLDELGNLQSDGKGIDGFETMLSIGLGQGMQFTLILQTLQQLRNVYGDDSDKILQGNTSNIIFLKSTDDSMIETLSKMSGTHHVSRANSKQITKDLDKPVGKTQGAISHSYQTEEEALITYNDMAFIAPRNSIVFRAGDAPIWNRNATMLPMSWRLFKDTIRHPGHEYNLKTIPTVSYATDFDVLANQPDFMKMLEKRMEQAKTAKRADQLYRELYGYKDVDIARLNPDVYTREVMEIIKTMIDAKNQTDASQPEIVDLDDYESEMFIDDSDVVIDTEVTAQVEAHQQMYEEHEKLRYAEGTVSRSLLINMDGSARTGLLDVKIGEAYKRSQQEFARDTVHFSIGGEGELRNADSTVTYISNIRSSDYERAAETINKSIADKKSRTFAESAITAEDLSMLASVQIHPEFYLWLASLSTWESFADGEFDRAMAIEMNNDHHDEE